MKPFTLAMVLVPLALGATLADAAGPPQGAAADADAASRDASTSRDRPLDLRIPDYTYYSGISFGADQSILSGEGVPGADDDVSTVEIQAYRPRVRNTPEIGVPYVTGGFGALFWAAMNPAQAWRIFLPDPLRAEAEGGR